MMRNFLYEFDRCVERELKEVILLQGVPRASRFSKNKDYSGESLFIYLYLYFSFIFLRTLCIRTIAVMGSERPYMEIEAMAVSLQSWISTGYFLNPTGSPVTNCRFSPIIGSDLHTSFKRAPKNYQTWKVLLC